MRGEGRLHRTVGDCIDAVREREDSRIGESLLLIALVPARATDDARAQRVGQAVLSGHDRLRPAQHVLAHQEVRPTDRDPGDFVLRRREVLRHLAQCVDGRMEKAATGIRLQADAVDLERFTRSRLQALGLWIETEQRAEAVAPIESLGRAGNAETGVLGGHGPVLCAIAGVQPFDRGPARVLRELHGAAGGRQYQPPCLFHLRRIQAEKLGRRGCCAEAAEERRRVKAVLDDVRRTRRHAGPRHYLVTCDDCCDHCVASGLGGGAGGERRSDHRCARVAQRFVMGIVQLHAVGRTGVYEGCNAWCCTHSGANDPASVAVAVALTIAERRRPAGERPRPRHVRATPGDADMIQ